MQLTIAGFLALAFRSTVTDSVSAGNGVAGKIDLCQLLSAAMSTGNCFRIAQNSAGLYDRAKRSHVYGNEDGCCGELSYGSDSGICWTVAGCYFTDDRTLSAGAVLNMRVKIISPEYSIRSS